MEANWNSSVGFLAHKEELPAFPGSQIPTDGTRPSLSLTRSLGRITEMIFVGPETQSTKLVSLVSFALWVSRHPNLKLKRKPLGTNW